MKIPRHDLVAVTCSAMLLAGMSSGCSGPRGANEEAAQSSEPKVEGNKITFPADAPQLEYLKVEPVRERSAAVTRLTGRLTWDDDITARVFSAVSGRIVEIVANPGQRVSAGDVLAKIKSSEFGQAQADARKAAADSRVAERALTRIRDLVEHGAAPQKDLETAEADSVRTRSEKERAFSTLSLYGGNPDAPGIDGVFSLKAPVEGTIVEKFVNPGQEVRSDQVNDKPLFVISDPTRLWLYLDVTEADVASLSQNQDVLIRVKTLPNREFHGHVDVINQGLDAATRTIRARCLVDNSEKLLRSEMYVSADVTNTSAAGVDISTDAVFLRDNVHYVFVETAPGRFERRAIELGPESNGRSIVLNALPPGQRVVTAGALLLESMLEGENA